MKKLFPYFLENFKHGVYIFVIFVFISCILIINNLILGLRFLFIGVLIALISIIIKYIINNYKFEFIKNPFHNINRKNLELNVQHEENLKIIENIIEYTEKIKEIILHISSKKIINTNFSQIPSYKEKLIKYEEITPIIINYNKNNEIFLKKYANLENEIDILKRKTNVLTGMAKIAYTKSLEEKQDILENVNNIKNNMKETENILIRMIEKLEQIDSILTYNEFEESISEEDLHNIDIHMDEFAELLNFLKPV